MAHSKSVSRTIVFSGVTTARESSCLVVDRYTENALSVLTAIFLRCKRRTNSVRAVYTICLRIIRGQASGKKRLVVSCPERTALFRLD